MKITAPGIYLDFPTADYFADPTPEPSLSQSIAKVLIERSPAHAATEHPRLALASETDEEEPEKYVASQAIGNAAHALMIGRGKTIAVGDFPDWRKAEAKAFKTEAIAAWREPILAKHMARAEAMVKAATDQIEAAGWLDAFHPDNGHGEVVIAWQENGLWLRSMIDWLATSGTVYDYKSTALSCAPHMIPNLMVNAGWDVQAAMIERGLNVLEPELAGRRKFRFVAHENYPPFALTPVEMTEAVMTMGRKKLDYAVAVWRRSMETDQWPAYGFDICHPEYPGYAESKWLTREAEEFDREHARPTQNILMAG